MKFDVDKLREKLDDYFSGKISKENLGKWAEKAYYDLLKGGYVESEKIVIYPFLRMISTFHLEENDRDDIYPCSEESVKKIQNILLGKINYNFDIEMSIPIQVYTMFKERSYFDKERRDKFFELKNIITSDYKQESKINGDIAKHLESIMCLNYAKGTIQGLLEEHIFLCLKNLFKNYLLEEEQNHFKLYAQKSKQNLIIERLLSYLDSYIGNKNFYIFVTFKEGISNIFLSA